MDPNSHSSGLNSLQPPNPTLAAAMSRVGSTRSSLQSNMSGASSIGPGLTFNGNNGGGTNKWVSFHWNDNRDTHAMLERSGLPVPAIEFTRFANLAAEIRCKIWGFVAYHPRIIEIEYCKLPLSSTITDAGSHPCHRVSPKSLQSPAVLLVNHESRNEALKEYPRCTFDSENLGMYKRYIRFNPTVDTIYFGKNTCIPTMVQLFAQAVIRGLQIRRVAIEVKKMCRSESCIHDRSMKRLFTHVSELKALHGVAPDSIDRILCPASTEWSGCPGLEQVFFVIKSSVWDVAAGDVDISVGFRPAIIEGMTKDLEFSKQEICRGINFVKRGWGLPKVPDTRWTEDDHPEFGFVSFAPATRGRPDARIHSGMVVAQEGCKKLEKNSWSFIKRLEARTGCDITVPKNPLPRRRPQEFGFFGTGAAIEKAQKAIGEEVKTRQDYEQWQKKLQMEDQVKRLTQLFGEFPLSDVEAFPVDIRGFLMQLHLP